MGQIYSNKIENETNVSEIKSNVNLSADKRFKKLFFVEFIKNIYLITIYFHF